MNITTNTEGTTIESLSVEHVREIVREEIIKWRTAHQMPPIIHSEEPTLEETQEDSSV